MRRRAFVAALHVGYWLIYLALLGLANAVLRVQTAPQATSTPASAGAAGASVVFAALLLVVIVPNVAAFYGAYEWLFPRFLSRQRFAGLAAGFVVWALACATLGLGIVYAFIGPDQPVFSSSSELAGLTLSFTVIAALHMALGLLLRGFVGWYDDIRVKQELERRTHAIELELLRSKLDPHFLFNTLNNIDVLIAKDPATASTYLKKLSEILRFALYETGGPAIPLSRELEYIAHYVGLQRLRTTNPGFVSHQVSDAGGDSGQLEIAPMLFIPFIENAFKHTTNRADDAIRIRFEIAGRRLSFSCRNRSHAGWIPRRLTAPVDIVAIQHRTAPGGLGNELIRRRLELLYPGRHTLTTARCDDTYSVELTIELAGSDDPDDPALHPG